MTRTPAFIASVLMTTAAVAADWQETLSPPTPGNFPLPAPLRAVYGFGWSALPAGEGRFDFSGSKAGQLRLIASMKTSGLAGALFKLDAHHTAIAHATTLRPVSVSQTEIYKDETIKSELKFDARGVTRTRSSNVPGPGNGKPKRLNFIPLFDLHTALFWIRSQRLRPGDTYRLVVYPSADAYLAEVKVAERENIRVARQSYPALRLELKVKALNKDLTTKQYKKVKRAEAWISDDTDRLLLKAEAEIFVGRVWAELEKIELRRPPVKAADQRTQIPR